MKPATKRRIVSLLLTFTTVMVKSNSLYAQLDGPTRVCPGVNYEYNAGTIFSRSFSWRAANGSIVSGGSGRYPVVRWNAGGGTLMLEYWDKDLGDYSHASLPVRTYGGGNITGPTNICAWMPFTLTLSGHVGFIDHWETRTLDGPWSSIPNSALYYHTNNGGIGLTSTYRAVMNTGGACLVYSAEFTVTILPPRPAPTVTNAASCGPGSGTLNANSGNAVNYHWYDPFFNKLPTEGPSLTTPVLTGTVTYFVKSIDAQGCHSEFAPATFTVHQVQAAPLQSLVTNRCDHSIVTAPPPPLNATFYWQSSETSHDTNNTSATVTVSNDGSFVYSRARNNVTGCWSDVTQQQIMVVRTPQAPPVPQQSVSCESIVLTAPPPPGNIVFYWQTSANGTSMANNSLTNTVSYSGTYWLRAKSTLLDCWSGVTSVNVTVSPKLSCLDEQNVNFVAGNEIQKEGVKEESEISVLLASDNRQTVSYVDGFGRVIQHVEVEGSPERRDIVQHVRYDQFGRQPFTYLPYAGGADGRYKSYALNQLLNFYNSAGPENDRSTTTRPFAETIFEASPLNRTLEQSAPGEDWRPGSGHTLKTNMRTNAANEVRLWEYDFATGRCITPTWYPAGELLVKETVDENGNKSWNYLDKQGRTVFSRKEISSSENMETYQVYDVFSRLRMVIQPEGVKELSAANWMLSDVIRDNWCFIYKYDRLGRLTEKKIPGIAPVYFVYNKRDQLILTQDGNQRALNQWRFTKYDALMRTLLTGLYTHALPVTQEQMQQEADSHTNQFEVRTSVNYPTQYGYTTGQSFPELNTTNAVILTAIYYDDYNYDFTGADDASYISSGLSPEPVPSLETINRVTGQVVRVLDTDQMLRMVLFYDTWGNVIQKQQQHHLGGMDVITSRYDFAGKLLESRQHQQVNAATNVVRQQYEYDHVGRLLRIKHKLNNDPFIILAEHGYNENGEMVEKKLHKEDAQQFKQKVDYRYNIRGWISRINDLQQNDPADLFAMEFHYSEGPVSQSGTGFYNGNVAEVVYKTPLTNKLKAYAFNYDKLNRLRSARYSGKGALDWNEDIEKFNEIVSYDLNGNILKLKRSGVADGLPAVLDELTYVYSGNKLMAVADAALQNAGFLDHTNTDQEYAYDANGNLTADGNKEVLSVEYNHMNLPGRVVTTQGEIIYTYDASGIKLAKEVTGAESGRRDYINGFEYFNGMLEFIHTDEGRILSQSSESEYQYYLKDHLGNVRLVFTTKNETDEATATFEAKEADTERGAFLYYDEAVKINSTLFDHTRNGSASYSERLNGTEGEQSGIARSLNVMPGDTIRAEVFAKYLDPEKDQWTESLTNLIAMIYSGVASPGTVLGEGNAGASGVPAFYTGLLNKNNEMTGLAPKAYLNYLVFDSNFRLLNSGFERITEAAREYGQDGPHERLATEIVITEPGYVYLYLSNENVMQGGKSVDVYFDDFSVQHAKSPIIQINEYYPFGLTFNNHQRDNVPAQRYLYNGKEAQGEFQLNWLDFGFRFYDAAIGRFTGVDPLAADYYWLTSYNYAENSPVANIDLWGLQRFYAADGSFLGQVGDDDDVRVINSALDNAQAKAHVDARSEERTQALMDNSVPFAEYFTAVEDVTNNAALETYSNHGNNCFDAANAQLDKAGVSQTGPVEAIQTLVDTDEDPALTADAFGGAIRVQTELNKGNPVMVGVKGTKTNGTVPDPGNRNSSTNHFVAIRSVTVAEDGTVRFNYLDNAKAATGKSNANNNFSLDTSTGAMTDTTTPGGRASYSSYEVSEVRKNRE